MHIPNGFFPFHEKKDITLASGYLWPGMKNDNLAAFLSGLLETLLLFFLGSGIGILVSRFSK